MLVAHALFRVSLYSTHYTPISVKNTLAPEWAKVFVFDYELGSPVKLAVSIFDEVKKGDNKSMGACIFDIGEVLGARGNTKCKRVRNGGM
jgi:hypothetical protein